MTSVLSFSAVSKHYRHPSGEVLKALDDVSFSVQQGEIAGLVGATREKVNRQLCAWCRSGILAFDEGQLTILDQGALRAIAQEG